MEDVIKVTVSTRHFRKASNGFDGLRSCPLYQALNEFYPNNDWSVVIETVDLLSTSESYRLQGWTEKASFSQKWRDFSFVEEVDRLSIVAKGGYKTPDFEVILTKIQK